MAGKARKVWWTVSRQVVQVRSRLVQQVLGLVVLACTLAAWRLAARTGPPLLDAALPHIAIVGHESPDLDGTIIGTDATADLRLTCSACAPLHGRLHHTERRGNWRYVHEGPPPPLDALRAARAGSDDGSPLFRLGDGSVLLLDVPADHEPSAKDCDPGKTPPGALRYRVSRVDGLEVTFQDRTGARRVAEIPAAPGFETRVGQVHLSVSDAALNVRWPGGTAQVPRGSWRRGAGGGWIPLPGFPADSLGFQGATGLEVRVATAPEGAGDFVQVEGDDGAVRVVRPPAWPDVLTVPWRPENAGGPNGAVDLFSAPEDTLLAGVARPGTNRTVLLCTPRALPGPLRWRVTRHGTSTVAEGERVWPGAGGSYRVTRHTRPWGPNGEPVGAVRLEPTWTPPWHQVLETPLSTARMITGGWRAAVPLCNPDERGAPRQFLSLSPSGENQAADPWVSASTEGAHETAFPVPNWVDLAPSWKNTPFLLLCVDSRGTIRTRQPEHLPPGLRLMILDDQDTGHIVETPGGWSRLPRGTRLLLAGQVLEVQRPEPAWAAFIPLLWLAFVAGLAAFRLEASMDITLHHTRAGDPGAGISGTRAGNSRQALRAAFGAVYALGTAGVFLAAPIESRNPADIGAAWLAAAGVLLLFPLFVSSRSVRWPEARWARAMEEVSAGAAGLALVLAADRITAALLLHRTSGWTEAQQLISRWQTWILPVLAGCLAWIARTGIAGTTYYRLTEALGNLRAHVEAAASRRTVWAGVVWGLTILSLFSCLADFPGVWTGGLLLTLFLFLRFGSPESVPAWMEVLVAVSAAWFGIGQGRTPAGALVLAGVWVATGAAFLRPGKGADRNRDIDDEATYHPPRSAVRKAGIALLVLLVAAGVVHGVLALAHRGGEALAVPGPGVLFHPGGTIHENDAGWPPSGWTPWVQAVLLLGLAGLAAMAWRILGQLPSSVPVGRTDKAAKKPKDLPATRECRARAWAVVLISFIVLQVVSFLALGGTPRLEAVLPWLGESAAVTALVGTVTTWTLAIGFEATVITRIRGNLPGGVEEKPALRTASDRALPMAAGLVATGVVSIVVAAILHATTTPRPGDIHLPGPGAAPLAQLSPAGSGCVRLEYPDSAPLLGSRRLCDGDRFEVGSRVLRLRSSPSAPEIVLTGVVTGPGIVGSSQTADAILPFPGMAARHLELLAPGTPRCNAATPCLVSLVNENRTRIQPASGKPAHSLKPGHPVPLRDGMVIWPGLAPLQVSVDAEHVMLEAPPKTTPLPGDRTWLAPLLPTWTLAGDGPWTIRGATPGLHRSSAPPASIATHTGTSGAPPGHDPDPWLRKEALQATIDAGLLCLATDPDEAGRFTLTWADTEGRCGGDPAHTLPRPDQLSAWRRVRHDPVVLDWIATTNTLLEKQNVARWAATLPFVFDWHMVATMGESDERGTGLIQESGQLVSLIRNPSRLLGVRWSGFGHTRAGHDATPQPDKAADLPAIGMRRHTTSPRLEVRKAFGPLRAGDALLLTGVGSDRMGGGIRRAPSSAPGNILLGAICLDAGLPSGRTFWRPGATGPSSLVPDDLPPIEGSVIPLGTLSLSQDRAWENLLGLSASPPRDGTSCLLLAPADQGLLVTSTDPTRPLSTKPRPSKQGDLRATIPPLEAPAPGEDAQVPTPATGTASKASDTGWQRVSPGSTLRWAGLTITYEDTGDAAAIPSRSASTGPTGERTRIYPFGADAAQLIGAGNATRSGLEAALRPAVLDANPARIDLTIHGDLQRILSRGLARAMEHDLDGRPRTDWTGRGTASAVLLDADTGAVLAAAVWPPMTPNAVRASARIDTRLFPTPERENLAFTRAGEVGSVYHLAAMIGMARSGLFDRPRTLPDRYDPARPAIYRCRGALQLYQRMGREVLPHRRPDTIDDDWPMVTCKENHAIWPDDPAWVSAVAPRALAQACNVFFGIGALSLVGNAGAIGGSIPYFYLNTDRADLALTDRLEHTFLTTPAWDPYAVVMAYFDPDDRGSRFIPGAERETSHPGNRFWSTLLALGHRFRYPLESGRETQQNDPEWAPGHAYPTAEQPWLPALTPGQGFLYPEIPGPAALGGDNAWPDGPPPPSWLNGRFSEIPRTRSLQTVLDVALGRQVSASPLSLAILAAPVASRDGRLVAPFVVASSQSSPPGSPHPRDTEEARILDPSFLTSGRETLVAGLRAALRDDPREGYQGQAVELTASLSSRRSAWLASRTGAVVATLFPRGAGGESGISSGSRLLLQACGVPVSHAEGGARSRLKRDGASPPLGIAAHTGLCRSLVPGMPYPLDQLDDSAESGISDWVGRVARATEASPSPRVVSSFVGVVFDPLVDPGVLWADLEAEPDESGATRPVEALQGETSVERASVPAGGGPLQDGRGLVLAVVCDNHPRAGQEAGVALLNDLALYYQIHGGALPGPAP